MQLTQLPSSPQISLDEYLITLKTGFRDKRKRFYGDSLTLIVLATCSWRFCAPSAINPIATTIVSFTTLSFFSSPFLFLRFSRYRMSWFFFLFFLRFFFFFSMMLFCSFLFLFVLFLMREKCLFKMSLRVKTFIQGKEVSA
jgi:4-amino-4-deoxy-L-arabinose transferase-like glycosyltransferase